LIQSLNNLKRTTLVTTSTVKRNQRIWTRSFKNDRTNLSKLYKMFKRQLKKKSRN